jgi:hypothetical protein
MFLGAMQFPKYRNSRDKPFCRTGPLAPVLFVATLIAQNTAAQIVTEKEAFESEECVETIGETKPDASPKNEPNYFDDAADEETQDDAPSRCPGISREEVDYVRKKTGGTVLVATGLVFGIPGVSIFLVTVFLMAGVEEVPNKDFLPALIPSIVGAVAGFTMVGIGSRMIDDAKVGFRNLGKDKCKSKMCLRAVSLMLIDSPNAAGAETARLRPAGLRMAFEF